MSRGAVSVLVLLLSGMPILAQTPHPGPCCDIVFVANGSGDFRHTTDGLCTALDEERLPMRVDTLLWSHGKFRYIADQTDACNHRDCGQYLASIIASYKQANPCSGVYLVGHSAGCAVLLAAAECLPADSIERIVLLAPSVSKDYHLRRALCATRCGIDVFWSCLDTWHLGICTGIVGTTDRLWTAPAGRVGFWPAMDCPGDSAIYAKLRQHAWDPDVCWTGHVGKHTTVNRVAFLRAQVVPLLRRCDSSAASYPPQPAGR